MTILIAALALACREHPLLAPGEVLPVVSVRDATEGPTPLMTVTVANIGLGSFSYGSCSLTIDRLESSGWEAIPEYRERVCSLAGLGLPAGVTRTFSVPRPTEPDLYRVRFVVRHDDQDFGVVSVSFAVGIPIADGVSESR